MQLLFELMALALLNPGNRFLRVTRRALQLESKISKPRKNHILASYCFGPCTNCLYKFYKIDKEI